MGIKNWIARRAGKRARKKWDNRNKPITTPRYRRKGTRMVPIKEKPTTMAPQPTREDYSKTTLAKKAAPAGTIVAVNVGLFEGVVNFIRGFKPEWIWGPEHDMEMLVNLNKILGGIWMVWVAAKDWKTAWFDRSSRSRLPG